METDFALTGYDFVVIGLAVLFIARGIWLGLLKQVTGLLAICLGYFAASQYHDRLFPFLKEVSDNPTVIFVASVVILFLATYLLTMLIGKGLSCVVEIGITKWFDKLLGAVLGAVMAAIALILLHMILGSVLAPENKMLRECQTCEGLNLATDYARKLIRDEDVRKSLMQQTPAISAEQVIEFFEGRQSGAEAGQEKSPVVE